METRAIQNSRKREKTWSSGDDGGWVISPFNIIIGTEPLLPGEMPPNNSNQY